MKKLVLLLAVMFSVSMFACKSSEATDAAADSAVVVEEEVVAVEEVSRYVKLYQQGRKK